MMETDAHMGRTFLGFYNIAGAEPGGALRVSGACS
jgi:hypothetical protein